jgi:hypothetical protein
MSEVQVQIPVSIGELFDKIAILEIKSAVVDDPLKLQRVEHELSLLRAIEIQFSWSGSDDLVAELKRTNEALWKIEDAIRDCERRKDFGSEFISLARSVYELNDRRAELKKQLNTLHGSDIVEEKNYASRSYRKA